MDDPRAAAEIFARLTQLARDLASEIRKDVGTIGGGLEPYTNMLLRIEALQRKVRVEMEEYFEASSARAVNVFEATTKAGVTLGDLASERCLFTARRVENLCAALGEIADDLATAVQTGRHLTGFRSGAREEES